MGEFFMNYNENVTVLVSLFFCPIQFVSFNICWRCLSHSNLSGFSYLSPLLHGLLWIGHPVVSGESIAGLFIFPAISVKVRHRENKI